MQYKTVEYTYFDIYNKLIKENGFMNPLFCDDTGHLNAEIVIEYLKEYL